MTDAVGVTNEQISRLCGYITDNMFIARYLDISPARVAKVRSEIRVPSGRRGASQGHITEQGVNISDAMARQAATASSRALLKALVSYGAKNDGLAGLTAHQFHALALEVGA